MTTAIGRLLREIFNLYRTTNMGTCSEYLWNVLLKAPKILLERSLVSVDQSMDKPAYRFLVGDKAILLPGKGFGLAREIIGRRIYELDERFDIRSGDCVIDLGANVGVFSLFAAAQGAQVIAIDAQSGFVAEILENSKMNGVDTVRPIHGIVAPECGVFASQEARSSASHWQVEPPKIDMNEVLREAGWSAVDFLKADVEGAEFELFTTGDEWVNKVRRIAMEVHPKYGNVGQLLAHLQERGFEVILTDLDKRPAHDLHGKMGYVYAIRQ
ncbi:FkbM family methyltransferase [Methylococcus sp. ANG]|uniref:FkbM family methyltransferase n=1 Tax=Methylococcus sp. ANG TaxID=3231903 RepID=UPI0034583E82